MSATAVTVDRLRCRVAVAGGAEEAFVQRDRIERLARRELASACGNLAARVVDGDDAIYRVRNLRLALRLEAATPDATVTERWGKLLASELARTVVRGDPDQIRRFASVASYLAAFVRDVLDGTAWGRWYFAEFHLLRGLPATAVALHVLAARPREIVPVLLELGGSGHGERLIASWGAAEFARLWTALDLPVNPALAGHPEPVHLAQIAGLWGDVPMSGATDRAGRMRDRFRRWLALAGRNPALGRDPAVVALLRALIDLAAILRTAPDLGPALLTGAGLYPVALRALASGPAGDACDWLGSISAMSGGANLLARLATIVTPGPSTQPTTPRWSSPVGGIYLLAMALAESGFWECWRAEFGEETARHLVHAVALKALGRERTRLCHDDRALACFAGLDEPPAGGDPPRSALDVDAWADEIPEVAARWYPPSRRDVVTTSFARFEIAYDAAARHWLAVVPTARSLPATVASGRAPSEEEEAAIEAEAHHLLFAGESDPPEVITARDAALAAATSLLLRRTAVRLPGLGRSGPAYLARQFLAQPATVERGGGLHRVTLTGGPLAAVLRMSVLPVTVRAAWLPEPLELVLAEPSP